jgi:hypothetical protein
MPLAVLSISEQSMEQSRDDNRKEVINQNCQHSAAAAERRTSESDAHQSINQTNN